MAVTAKIYSAFFENLGGGDTAGEGPMDLLSDALKVILTTSTNTINQSTDTVKADITNELSTAGGYTAGGATLGSKTWTISATTTCTLDAADTAWTSATFSADQAHIYDDTPTSPADPLISYVDFGATQTVSSGTFTLQWNASGILTVTVA